MRAERTESVAIVTCEYPPFPGGIGTYAAGLVGALRGVGIPTAVFAPSYPDLPRPGPESDTARFLGHHAIGPGSMWRIASLLGKMPRNRLVLAADIRSMIALYVLQPIVRRPYRVMIHGSEVSKLQSRSPIAALARRAYRSADRVIANSKATLDLFTSAVGATERSIVAYLGVESTWFQPVEGGFEHPELAGLPDAANVICSVGRIEPRKGQIEAVRAIAHARDAHGLRDPVYVIAGRSIDDRYTEEVIAEAARLQLSLIVTGRVSEADLKRLFRRSVCHVLCAQALPGKIEGFGLVLLEAAAQSCPSVASRVGGIPEVMGETGIIVEPDDKDALALAMTHYAADPGLRAQHGAAALDRARQFTWTACAEATFPELFPH